MHGFAADDALRAVILTGAGRTQLRRHEGNQPRRRAIATVSATVSATVNLPMAGGFGPQIERIYAVVVHVTMGARLPSCGRST